MAFNDDNLRPSGGNEHLAGKMLYETNDSISTVEGSSYFDEASGRLDDAPYLRVVADRDGTPVSRVYLVSVSNGSVTLNALTKEAKLTDNSGGTADDTIAAVSGSGADTTINNNFADLAAKCNAILNYLGV